MSNKIFLLAFVTIAGINATPLFSQTTSASSYFSVQPASDRTVIFNVADPGVSKPII